MESVSSVLPHACYLLALLTFDGSNVIVAGYGIFSEPEPTINPRYIPAQIWKTCGRTYDEADKEIRDNIIWLATKPGREGGFWKTVLGWLKKNPQGIDW